MNCFQLVKTVLDEIYTEIPLRGKDEAIKAELDLLRRKYANLLSGEIIDYANPITRFAYIYRYVTSHANIAHTIIESCSELTDLMDANKVNMTCVGGGPGSDLLGVLKYLINSGKSPMLRCILYDREEAWGESWNDVDNKLGTPFRISTFFQSFDVGERNTWTRHSKYLTSDLFTMIYFMSEIFRIRATAEPFFENLFAKAKKDSLFLYVDNNSPDFYNWFDELAERNSLATIKSATCNIRMNGDEQKTDLGVYYEKFNFPKLTADISYRVCIKQ